MTGQKGLMGVALAVKRGTTKITEVPVGVRKQVERLMESVNLDEFSGKPSTDTAKFAGRARHLRKASSV